MSAPDPRQALAELLARRAGADPEELAAYILAHFDVTPKKPARSFEVLPPPESRWPKKG